MKHSSVSVASTATKIISEDRAKAGFIIANVGTVTVYLGTSAVTTSNGLPLDPGEKVASDGGTEYQGDLYGIISTGTNEVRTLEWGKGEI